MDNVDEFVKSIGSLEDHSPPITGNKAPYVPLKEALWQCSNEFNKKGSTIKDQDFKRVWLFTNDDNPNCKYPQEQLQIIQVAKDAAETGIEISLWHMNKSIISGNNDKPASFYPFNIDIFYNKLLVVDDEEELSYRTKSAGDDGFDCMLAQVRKKEFKKRRMGSLMFHLGGICVYLDVV